MVNEFALDFFLNTALFGYAESLFDGLHEICIKFFFIFM